MQEKLKKLVTLVSEELISKGIKGCKNTPSVNVFRNEYSSQDNLLLISRALEGTKILLDLSEASSLKLASAVKSREYLELDEDIADILKEFFNNLLGAPNSGLFNTMFIGGENLKYYPPQNEFCTNFEFVDDEEYLMTFIVVASEENL